MTDKIMRLDLIFYENKLEQQYQNWKNKYQKAASIIVIIYGVLISIISSALNPYEKPIKQPKLIVVIFFLLFLNFSVFMISRKRPQYSDNLITLLITFYLIGMMESTLPNREEWNNIMSFLLGMTVSVILVSSILCKISWKKSTTIILLINILCCFRYSPFELNQSMGYFPLTQHIINTVILSSSSYFLERHDRHIFYYMKNYELTLSCFKDLIENVLPSSIVIIKDGETLFRNEETFNILSLPEKNRSFVLPALESILIMDNGSDINNRNTDYTLKDALRQSYDLAQSNEKENIWLYGVYHSEAGEIKDLEIKIRKIHWERKSAVMIVSSVNHYLLRLKIMNEQAEYKDRLLATVSHDLRTPLNGIMGMISMALEVISEPSTKK